MTLLRDALGAEGLPSLQEALVGLAEVVAEARKAQPVIATGRP
ncbi:hypothetical protein [Candidatus Poriferisocius sp.]